MCQGQAHKLVARTIACLVLLCAALSFEPGNAEPACIETQQQALLARRFTMGVGRSIIVDLPKDAAEIVVANPAVANAVVRSPRKIFVLATGAGQTTIFALDQQGKQVANIDQGLDVAPQRWDRLADEDVQERIALSGRSVEHIDRGEGLAVDPTVGGDPASVGHRNLAAEFRSDGAAMPGRDERLRRLQRDVGS